MEDSTSSAIAPTEEMEDKHKELVMDMFEKITEYLNGELAGKDINLFGGLYLGYFPPVTSEEYELLLRLNQMTVAKYSDMTSLAGRLNQVSQKLHEKCEFCHGLVRDSCISNHSLPPSHAVISLQPYCDQIDQVEASVSALEQTAYRLDAYCKQLEAKFKEIEKR